MYRNAMPILKLYFMLCELDCVVIVFSSCSPQDMNFLMQETIWHIRLILAFLFSLEYERSNEIGFIYEKTGFLCGMMTHMALFKLLIT
jgi:hypothetical protein